MIFTLIACLMAAGAQTRAPEVAADLERLQAALPRDDAEACYQLALCAERNGLKTESKRLLRKVIKIDPNHEWARDRLGYKLLDVCTLNLDISCEEFARR